MLDEDYLMTTARELAARPTGLTQVRVMHEATEQCCLAQSWEETMARLYLRAGMAKAQGPKSG